MTKSARKKDSEDVQAWLVDGASKRRRSARKASRSSTAKASPAKGKRTQATGSRGAGGSEWIPKRKPGARAKPAKRAKRSIEEPGSNGRGANGGPTTSKAARPWQGLSIAERRRGKALEKRVEELEAELQSVRKKARAEIKRLRAQLEGDDSSGPSSATSAPKSKRTANGRVDVNTATFEELRGLGLSVSQTSRLLSSRERNGGFRAKAQLKEIPGLSKATRELIDSRLTIRR